MEQSTFFNPYATPQPDPMKVGVIPSVQVNTPGFQAEESKAREFIDTSVPQNNLLEIAKMKKQQSSAPSASDSSQPYNPSGKTQEQIMAETGRQSELDQMSQPAPQVQMQQPPATQQMEVKQPPVMQQSPVQQQAMPPQTQPEVMQPAPQISDTKQSSVFGDEVSVSARANKPYLNGRINRGTDFAGKAGTPVALPEGEWEVVQARNDIKGRMTEDFSERSNFGWGNSVVVRNTKTGEQMRMSHMKEGTVPDLKPGQTLSGGTVVGAIGNTGNTHGATGNHLDVEYYDAKGRRGDVLNSQYGSAFTSGKPAAQPPAAPQEEKVQVDIPSLSQEPSQSASIQPSQPVMMNNEELMKLWSN